MKKLLNEFTELFGLDDNEVICLILSDNRYLLTKVDDNKSIVLYKTKSRKEMKVFLKEQIKEANLFASIHLN